MVDVSNYSPRSSISDDQMENFIPEDNVERLRNIRDMFENTNNDEDLVLQKVEKLQPSDKIKDRFKKFEEGLLDDEEEGEEEVEGENGAEEVAPKKTKNKKKDIIAFADLNNVKNKFENIANETEVPSTPKPMRSITPPPDGALRTEIENEPMQRPANVVSVYEKVEDALPAAGYTRSRKEIFTSAGSPSDDQKQTPRVKSITPPRDEALKRVLKEQTPERNENVARESDRIDDVLPNAGAIKQTAAIFTNSSARLKSIERSGISIEGELAEKGIAKSRLALFNDPNALQSSTVSTTELESEIMKNASGIAKERLNLFKNLEQQTPTLRTSPSRELKKLKEFTPPPQLDHQQRQYIIIDKENNETDAVRESSQQREEFMPETGIAKSRMKQYLESTSQNGGSANENGEPGSGAEELPKGLAKSLLAKWKSIENVKDKETSPESSRNSANGRQNSPDSNSNEECLPQSGMAKSLLNKFQNIESSSSARERKGPRPITPPPFEEIERQRQINEQEGNDSGNAKPYVDEELAIIGRGHAKSTLAKFEQSVIESTQKVKKSVTPPREFIKQINNNGSQSVFESTPVDSGINAQFAEEEVIPAAGNAKNLKNKFLNLEKEASKIETSSSKMAYVPKKFTSATSPMTSNGNSNKPTNGTSKTNGQKPATNGTNGHSNSNSNAEKCCVCEKTVYAMEKIEADKKVYHKLCFKCTSCNCTLNEDNFAFEANKPYCVVDHKKVTQTKTPPASPAKSAAKKDSASTQHLEAKSDQSKSSPKHEPKSPKAASKTSTLEPPKSPAKSAEAPKSPKADPKSAKTLEPPKSPNKSAATEAPKSPKKDLKPEQAPKSPKVEAKSPVKAK